MYESFYGLNWRPFAAAPDPAGCVSIGSIPEALPALRRCVEDSQGIAILTAPAGLGKTLVVRKLLDEFNGAYANVFLANSTFSSRRAFLQAVLYELGQTYTQMDEQELRLSLISAVRAARSKKRAVLLAIDEAHLLDEAVLDEVRSATNLVGTSDPLVRVILCGQLLLEEKLASPSLDSLNQRVGCHVSLEPLSLAESAEYVRQRLNWAGAEIGRVMTADAVQAICQASDGIPRCINHLCDHCLLLGYVADTRPIPRSIVLEALDDLRQLPLHWNAPWLSAGSKLVATSRDTATASPAIGERDPDFVVSSPDMASIEVGADEPRRAAADVRTGVESPAAATSGGFSTSLGDNVGVVEFGAPEVERETAPAAKRVSADSAAKRETPSKSFVGANDVVKRDARRGNEFEEEIVFDRYALLDARKESARDRGFKSAAAGTSTSRLRASGSPDLIIDAVAPLLDAALDIPTGPECDAEDVYVGDVRYYDYEIDGAIEERIGASVLDTCLETQQAIDNFRSAAGCESAEHAPCEADCDQDSPGNDCQYDVVEPEIDATDPRRPPGMPANKPHEPNRQLPYRQYQKLFTELRRRGPR